MSFALIFPGQGSQALGMLSELAAAFPTVRVTFEEAADVLGRDLWQLCQTGPEGALGATVNTQPVLLTASVAQLRVWREAGGAAPDAVAGHSLGEYSALVAAGAIDFQTALQLVQARAEAMQRAVVPGAGLMAAVLGLDDDGVAAACRLAADVGVVVPANLNAPGQVVIAGARAAVEQACEHCKAAGAKRAMPLAVSVPSHSPLMAPAREALEPRLGAVAWRDPAVPVYQNATAAAATTADGLSGALARQLVEPVRWVETITAMHAAGIETFVECGPGKVLAALNKRIVKSARTLGSDTPETMHAALAELGA